MSGIKNFENIAVIYSISGYFSQYFKMCWVQKIGFLKFKICIFLSILPPLGLLPGVITLLVPSPSYTCCAKHEITVVCQWICVYARVCVCVCAHKHVFVCVYTFIKLLVDMCNHDCCVTAGHWSQFICLEYTCHCWIYHYCLAKLSFLSMWWLADQE